MAPRATPLSNAQVEQALGPEPDNAVAQRAVEGEEAVIGGNGMQGEQQ